MPVLSTAVSGDCLLEKLIAAHHAGHLRFFGQHVALAQRKAFATYLAPLRKVEWYLYTKRPFGGPEAVLAYLSRYTHRIAISNSRLIAFDGAGVAFKYKDYRVEGRERNKVMTLATTEFIRRFLVHVLPDGFHRIRSYGLFANGCLCREHRKSPRSAPRQRPDKAIDAAGADTTEPPTPSRIHVRAAAAA